MTFKTGIISKLLCIWLLLFLILGSYAQNTKFKRLNIEEGLSAVTVNTLFQDSKDFIWIGTQDGLNRYDGYHFKVFKNNLYDKNSISSNDVKCIYEDEDGILYFGSNGGGLSVYNAQTENFVNYKSGLSAKSISTNSVKYIFGLNNKQLLVATADGLNVFDKQTKFFSKVNSSNANTFETRIIYKTSDNRIFVGSFGEGLFEYDQQSKTLVHFPIPDDILSKKANTDFKTERSNFRCLTEVNGNIWCGTDQGIIVFNPSTNRYTDVLDFRDKGNYNNRITSFEKDKNSNFLWIGTWGGLMKYNLSTHTHELFTYNEFDQNSLSNNKISCLLKDKQKNLWVGTEDNGLSINFSSYIKFPVYNQQNGLDNDFVYSLLQTKNKDIWAGTADGIYKLAYGKDKFTNESDILNKYKSKTALSLCEDKEGNIWIGTYGQGIIIYNPKTGASKRVLDENSTVGTITKIVQDNNNVIWVGTFASGLYAINPQTLTYKSYNTTNGLTSNAIYTIFHDKEKNTIWVGTMDAGVCIMDFVVNIDKPLITSYKHNENKNSISSNSINNIYKDKTNTFWIGTSNGLNKFNSKTKTFTVYTEKDGLPNSYIYDVIPDSQNNLWLPTNAGLSRFNPNIENDNGNAFKNYNTKDGIQAREFNQGASFLCSDGKILVGGISGINYFEPKSIKDNIITPKSYIYSFSRQGKEITADTSILLKKHIELSYKENYFTFELVTLDYVSPEKNKFMYKLEGYDRDWSSPSNVRYISYTELPGGTYNFKVKATNSDGIWNEVPYQITIKVIPPWWKTTWFYILSVLFTAGLVFGFISYRTRSIKKENKILENKVEERTKELAEKNRDITSSIEYAKRIQEAILPSRELIFSKLKNAFILYKPKDIVSGDFYWFGEKGEYKIIAVVDCTGHGVPGAFMSMIGHNLLNQIVSEKGISDPGQILEHLHKGVQSALKQGHNDVNTNDGMDVSLLAINTEAKTCLWAGAFRSLVIVNNDGDLEKIDGNKYPVGGAQMDSARLFTTHSRQLNKGDMLYMTTDGYADQFGGAKGKKFMVRQFHDNLVSLHQYSVSEQHKELEKHFNTWRGDFEQVDDVLVIGIKV